MNGKILPPVYYADGERMELKSVGDGVYETDRLRAIVREESLGPGRSRLVYRWENLGTEALRCQLELRVQADFSFDRYLIPGVSVNGNHWGKGKEPKGLSLEGQPWIFDYRRTAIPACTISENREQYLALFASDESPVSLQASCSMVPQENGSMLHRLLYPCMEGPKTYCTRDGYREAQEDFLYLQPGGTLTTVAYLLWGAPRKENFAAADVEDAALELLGSDFPAKYSSREVADLCCKFAKTLVVDRNGRKLFSIGQLPDEQGRFGNREGNEFGWCGQNGMYARLFLERGFQTGDRFLTETAVSNLDAWSQEAVGKTGLIHTHYHWMLEGETDTEDTCNLGFAISELTSAWETARQNGMEKPEWLAAAKGTAEFLVAHYSEKYGFGKSWNVETGECEDPEGTIGAYVIPGLVRLWRATGEERWLDAARKACRFYRDRDLAVFSCKAGALDTYCIDKESSGPLLIGALELYQADGEKEWLECAEMAGWYFCSWMFHHDTIPALDSDFARYGYRTLGGTSVSAQHHHIDPWGALVVPQMFQLWRITGDEHWRRRGQLLWGNAIQNIAPEEGKEIHGLHRPAGAQNEGYHHCNWGDANAPGYINDWLVAWPQAFCWNAAKELAAAIPVIAPGPNAEPVLFVDNEPFLMLGGELHNSASSSLLFMEKEVWPNIRPYGLNTVILPLAWESVEPVEGTFDFSLLEGILQQARRENVRLVLLWFGLWKNGESFYVPEWVKADQKRFFRAQYRGRIPSETISPLCREGVEADARAFVRVMEYLREHDSRAHTVVMVQVENEIGFRLSERDFGRIAQAAYAEKVPEEITQLYGVRGSWKEALGEDAPEYFMAYHYAKAIERIASAGKKVFPLPMYVNTWLDHHPSRPGVFPTGGPVSRLIPLWKRLAPSLDLIAPDIYEPDFKGICESFKRDGNPLFIPEARRDPVTASNVFYAFGGLNALGFSPFAIEYFLKDDVPKTDAALLEDLKIEESGFNCHGTAPYLIQSYRVLNGMLPLIAALRGTERMMGFIRSNPDEKGCILSMGEYDLQLDYLRTGAGHPGSAGIIIRAEKGIYISGCNVKFTPIPKKGSDTWLTLVRLEEGEFQDGVWVPGRVLNGDETSQMELGDMAETKYLQVHVHLYDEVD
ncbi:MAG: DUF5597 domain-containing protein [Eubacteriales bacterium]|nr:DUF5597 domain-containing protein [Eubacteriales bacterium]